MDLECDALSSYRFVSANFFPRSDGGHGVPALVYLRSCLGGFLQMGIAPRAVPSMRKWTISIVPFPCSAGILSALLNLLTPRPNFAAIRLLQTNFSACYRHLTSWERNANSNTAPDGERKGRVSGTTAVGPQAGWRRYLPSMAASAMLSNF